MIVRSLALLLVAAPLAAQQTSSARPADFRWEKALAAGSLVALHNLNGNVSVSPSTSGKVEVVGVKRGRYADDVTLEVVETSRGVMVCAMFKDKDVTCDEDGYRVHDDRRSGRRRDRDDWDDSQIDIVVKVPKDLRVSANSVSGDVEISGAEGSVRASSVSGNVRLDKLRATTGLRATSVSGDVWVVVESFAGDGDLHFTSVSGNVTAELPKAIDADVRMSSVSGSLDSDFPLTLNGRMSRHSLEARIGKGGRQLEVTTVSGDVRLRAARQ
jgi:Putative adhesin